MPTWVIVGALILPFGINIPLPSGDQNIYHSYDHCLIALGARLRVAPHYNLKCVRVR